MTARNDGVNEIANRLFIELNTCDAEASASPTGTSCKVIAPGGSIESVAHVSEKTLPGHTWMPFHFQDGNSNWLTIAARLCVEGPPEYKVCAEGGEGVGCWERAPVVSLRFHFHRFQRRGALL